MALRANSCLKCNLSGFVSTFAFLNDRFISPEWFRRVFHSQSGTRHTQAEYTLKIPDDERLNVVPGSLTVPTKMMMVSTYREGTSD